jgi:hypothetical protein
MLRKDVAVGNKVTTAHSDTCATYFFLSRKASDIAAARGYRAFKSKVRYSLGQGDPLCVTSTVHAVSQHDTQRQHSRFMGGSVVHHRGANITTRYRILQLGGIVDYDPIHHQTTSMHTLCTVNLSRARSSCLCIEHHANTAPPESNFYKVFFCIKNMLPRFLVSSRLSRGFCF